MQTSSVVSLKTTIKWLFGMLHFFSSTQNLSFSYIFLFSLAFSLIYVSSAGTNLTSGFSITVCASISQLVIRSLTLTIYWHYQRLPFLIQTHRLSLMWVFTYWHTFSFSGKHSIPIKERENLPSGLHQWWSRTLNSILVVEKNKQTNIKPRVVREME